MSTLTFTIPSDDEDDNNANSNISKRRNIDAKITRKDEVISDEEDEENDEMDNDFDFGGLMVRFSLLFVLPLPT